MVQRSRVLRLLSNGRHRKLLISSGIISGIVGVTSTGLILRNVYVPKDSEEIQEHVSFSKRIVEPEIQPKENPIICEVIENIEILETPQTETPESICDRNLEDIENIFQHIYYIQFLHFKLYNIKNSEMSKNNLLLQNAIDDYCGLVDTFEKKYEISSSKLKNLGVDDDISRRKFQKIPELLAKANETLSLILKFNKGS